MIDHFPEKLAEISGRLINNEISVEQAEAEKALMVLHQLRYCLRHKDITVSVTDKLNISAGAILVSVDVELFSFKTIKTLLSMVAAFKPKPGIGKEKEDALLETFGSPKLKELYDDNQVLFAGVKHKVTSSLAPHITDFMSDDIEECFDAGSYDW